MTITKMITNDEIFLREFLKDFYHKIIDADDLGIFEDTLIKWIKDLLENHDKDLKDFLKMMQNHQNHQIWFTSLVGFFYQHGIGCDISRNMSLKLYSLNDNGNGMEVDKLQDMNIMIGNYLLSLFYYKDIILVKRFRSEERRV